MTDLDLRYPDLQERARQLVAREVFCCVSQLIHTLAVAAQTCRIEGADFEEDLLPILVQEAPNDPDAEPSEAYEHWLVSDWLADKLREKGEMVGEVCGLMIWGRCTTGQVIYMDHVIQEIAEEVMYG